MSELTDPSRTLARSAFARGFSDGVKISAIVRGFLPGELREIPHAEHHPQYRSPSVRLFVGARLPST